MIRPCANKLISKPSIEPVSMDDLRQYLRLDTKADDSRLSALIAPARQFFEESTGRALISQTWLAAVSEIPREGDEQWWDGVREGAISEIGRVQQRVIELPRGPLIEVTEVKYYDDKNNSTTDDLNKYYQNTIDDPGQLVLNNGEVWPTFTRPINGLEITYKAGYGDDVDDIPFAIKQCLLQLCAHWYENRQVVKSKAMNNIPLSVQNIIQRYKYYSVA